MDEAITSEIEQIEARLAAIGDEREDLSPEDTGRRDAIVDEVHKLESQLAQLQDRAADEGAGDARRQAAAQTDITRPPRLPETESDG